MARPWRLFWLFVLGFHAVTAAAWWWLMPGGFPILHPRFWSNEVAPLAVLAVVVAAVRASRRQRVDVLGAVLTAFPAAWMAAAVASRVVFPLTLGRLFALPLLGGALMGAAVWLTFRKPVFSGAWGVAAVAVVFGALLPLTQRAPAPDTRPLNSPLSGATGTPSHFPGGKLGPRLMVHPGDGSLTVQAGPLRLSVQPILRFLSRSPDGCLTILAPPRLREGPEPRLLSTLQDGARLTLRFRADDEATLWIDTDTGSGPMVLEATTRLPRPVFSHLNSYCDLEVTGHRRLSLSFSPCSDRLVEVRPADYPVGRPLRLAYRDAHDGFHVVEATSGEKGPFRELARGRLGRSEPLAITLHDGGTPIASVVLEDWAAQTGTTLSPTAGWGVPVNAIEFSLEGDAPGSPAAIYTTLAGTSVGRGWDSVGHAAGTYRNRMRIDVLGPGP